MTGAGIRGAADGAGLETVGALLLLPVTDSCRSMSRTSSISRLRFVSKLGDALVDPSRISASAAPLGSKFLSNPASLLAIIGEFETPGLVPRFKDDDLATVGDKVVEEFTGATLIGAICFFSLPSANAFLFSCAVS